MTGSRFPRRNRNLASIGLGASLARKGILPTVALVVSVMTVASIVVLTIVLAIQSSDPPLHDLPILASSALAWGGGFLLAFSSSAHALRRDRTEGIRDLFAARNLGVRGYLVGRIGGLSVVLAAVVGGGTLLCGLVASLASTRAKLLPDVVVATVSSTVFALAFAFVMGPLALAALGARSRAGGYLFLLAVVVMPEILVGIFGARLPESISDVVTLPSALSALRAGLTLSSFDPIRALRGVLAIVVYAAFAAVLVGRDVRQLERTEASR